MTTAARGAVLCLVLFTGLLAPAGTMSGAEQASRNRAMSAITQYLSTETSDEIASARRVNFA